MAAHRPLERELHSNGPTDARWKIALAHGAGAGMDTPFMNAFAEGFASAGLRVARFEFQYMASFRVVSYCRCTPGRVSHSRRDQT